MNFNQEIDNSTWQGKISLDYQCKGNKTYVNDSFASAPFKLQKSFYPEGNNPCHTVILHTAGGIVGGDYLSQNINLGQNSQVLITTPSASKIYRSNQKFAKQDININLHNNSFLEYLPQEIIVFNQSYYHQKTIINLSSNALFLGWEIIRFGRTAREEFFTVGEWLNYTEIWQGNKPLWIDRQHLQGESNLFFLDNGLGGKPVMASLVFVGKNVNLKQEVRALVNDENLAVTHLSQGLLCRYHGDSVQKARQCLIQIWQYLRSLEGKSAPFTPRIWQ